MCAIADASSGGVSSGDGGGRRELLPEPKTTAYDAKGNDQHPTLREETKYQRASPPPAEPNHTASLRCHSCSATRRNEEQAAAGCDGGSGGWRAASGDGFRWGGLQAAARIGRERQHDSVGGGGAVREGRGAGVVAPSLSLGVVQQCS